MPLASPRPAPSELWAKLEALDLDGGAQLSFSKRLARDNGWTSAFAQRVVLEYKRFVFLAATCGHPVTPSDEVDQAWHLHLVYTRSYWDELCGEVLGFPLHHGPTKGGMAEGHKFQDWYARTLQAYVAAFGTAPPADIWPAAAVRFGEAPYFRRVNLRRQWLLPRPRWPFRLGWRGWLGLAGVLVLASCTARMPLNPLNWYGTEFLGLFWGLCATVLPLAVWLRYRGQGPATEYIGELPSAYALARLADHGQRVVDCALAALVHTGHASIGTKRRIRRSDAPPPTNPCELAVWYLIAASGWSDIDKVRKRALSSIVEPLPALDHELEANGLLLSATERRRLDRIPLLAGLGLALLGGAKVLVGLSRHRPVEYLVISLCVLGMAMLSYYQQYRAWATGRGIRLLNDIGPAVRQKQRSGEAISGQMVALSVAVFGVAELHALGMGAMAVTLLPPQQNSDGGSGCGSSGCGGSGCGGGGCGGCGGCGS